MSRNPSNVGAADGSEDAARQRHSGADGLERLAQGVAHLGGALLAVAGLDVEDIADEDRVRRLVRQARAIALTPVPTAAGDAGVVTPDDFAGVGVLDRLGARRYRRELLVAGG